MQEATSIFIDKFAVDDDWVQSPSPWRTRFPPDVRVFAKFIRKHDPEGSDGGSVLLDEASWDELIENVEKIRLVFIPRLVEMPPPEDINGAPPGPPPMPPPDTPRVSERVF